MPNSRIDKDFYPTPDPLTQALIDIVFLNGVPKSVLEPCAGDGAIAKFFPRCLTNEPYPTIGNNAHYTLDATRQEFWDTVGNPNWIITNPPYRKDLLLPIVKYSLSHCRVGVAMLLRLSFLEPCGDRKQLLKENKLSHLIVLNPRPKFRADIKGTDSTTVAWFVWQKHWQTETSIHFVNWK